ncbi:MAG: SUMF1/EgtB/PvdO family nonheme iron enzyme [Akkermansiaceae bacterium]|nr:SUMF1/EgtB/PvdO family nonheme iron enzyme [Akkermansiaceae bacterium]
MTAIPGFRTRADGYLSARKSQVSALATNYLRGLDARLNQAADGGNLTLAKAFRGEKARVEALQKSLAAAITDPVAAVGQSATLPDLPEGSPAELAALRQTWETERQKIRDDLDAKLRQSLQALERELTKAREFELADAVVAYRQGLEKPSSPAIAATTESAAMAVSPSDAAGKSARAPSPSDLAAATKENPFENSLGMKFVPVPGTNVLFCIHETRWKDFATYAMASPLKVNEEWKIQTIDGFPLRDRSEDHPVIRVSWDDANAFCAWMSQKEGLIYRLPTRAEWLIAASGEYPWGTGWPPPNGVGNFSDASRKAKAPSTEEDAQYLDDYDDGFPTTAPVMSFPPNEFKIFDLGGNAGEWLQDISNPAKGSRSISPSSWSEGGAKAKLLSSHSVGAFPQSRYSWSGFRLVLEIGVPATSPAPTAPASPAIASAPAGTLKNPFGWKPIPVNPFPLKRPELPTTPCRVVAWRLDGKPVDEATFRKEFGGVPADMGEVVDLWGYSSISSRFMYPLSLDREGKVRLLNQRSASYLPNELKPGVALSGGRHISAVLHGDGTATMLFLSDSATQSKDLFESVASWKDLTAISISERHILGLTSSGIPLATGDNALLQCEIPPSVAKGALQVFALGRTSWILGRSNTTWNIERFGDTRWTSNMSPKPGDSVFFTETLFVADNRGRLSFSSAAPGVPQGIDKIAGTPRDIRDVTLAQGKFEDGMLAAAALREGEDQWRFWGDRGKLGGFDTKYCEAKAAGCWKLYPIGDYVIALKPVANLKPDDWTGAKDGAASPPPAPKPETTAPAAAVSFPLPIPKRPTVAGRLEVYRRDGKPIGSQPDDNGLAKLPADLGNNVVAISVGSNPDDKGAMAVALLSDGTVRLWSSGIDSSPVLIDRPIPDPTLSLAGIVEAKAGTGKAVFLNERGEVFGTGGEGFTPGPVTAPHAAVPASLPGHAVKVDLKNNPAFALLADGSVAALAGTPNQKWVPEGLPPSVAIAAGWGCWALGADGKWRGWYDREPGKIAAEVASPDGAIAQDAGGSGLFWIDRKGKRQGARYDGSAALHPRIAGITVPSRQLLVGNSIVALEVDRGEWQLAIVSGAGEQSDLEAKLRGCSSIASSNVYVFGIRPLGK